MVNGLQVTHESELYALDAVKLPRQLIRFLAETGAVPYILQHVVRVAKVPLRRYIFFP